MLNTIKRFLKNRGGNIAVIFAIVAAPLMLSVGVATDYAVNRNAAKELQEILDAAVLAGATDDGTNGEKLKNAQNFFEAQIAGENEYIAAATAKFYFNGSNTLEGTASTKTPLFILGSFIEGPLEAGVASAAVFSEKVKSVRFNPTDGQGWWEKKVRLMVVRPGESTPVEVQNVHYAVSRRKPPERGTVTTSPGGFVDLGEYDKAYLEFTIGPRAYEFDKWCPGCPKVLRSDDPNTSDRFTIDGKKVPKGTVLDIFDFAKCGETSSQAWEDGGGGIPDISYDIEAKCGTNPKTVRLIK